MANQKRKECIKECFSTESHRHRGLRWCGCRDRRLIKEVHHRPKTDSKVKNSLELGDKKSLVAKLNRIDLR
jgi:hypothetical protein